MPRKPRREGYWIEKLPGGNPDGPYYRFWYDPATRHTRRESLDTDDYPEAQRRAALRVEEARTLRDDDPAHVSLAKVMAVYLEEHATTIAGFDTAVVNARRLLDGFGDVSVAACDRRAQQAYVAARRAEGVTSSTISRELATLRAAFRRAVRHGQMTGHPFVHEVESAAEKKARPPKGRPLSLPEMVRLFRAAREPHVRRYLLTLCATMARPEAIREIHLGRQYDRHFGILNLNQPGRVQNRKHRPTIPVLPVLAEEIGDEQGWLISYRGKPIRESKTGWRGLRARAFPPSEEELAALPVPTTTKEKRARALLCTASALDIQAYSIRHTMARALRRAKVPKEEISVFLGHRVEGSSDITEIYAPYDPDYCRGVAEILDKLVRMILAAAASDASPDEVAPKMHPDWGSVVDLLPGKPLEGLVGATRIELVTPTMSRISKLLKFKDFVAQKRSGLGAKTQQKPPVHPKRTQGRRAG